MRLMVIAVLAAVAAGLLTVALLVDENRVSIGEEIGALKFLFHSMLTAL